MPTEILRFLSGKGKVMKVDIGPLLRGECGKIDIDFTLTPEPIEGVEFESDAKVRGCVTDNAGYMRLTLDVELPYKASCARCLDEVSDVFEVSFERTVATPGMLSEQQLADNVDEYVVVEHGMLDVDEELTETLILEFPTKIVCSEDCEGLCPVCGKPKREGCGCVEKHVDPRLAVLASLLERDDDEFPDEPSESDK